MSRPIFSTCYDEYNAAEINDMPSVTDAKLYVDRKSQIETLLRSGENLAMFRANEFSYPDGVPDNGLPAIDILDPSVDVPAMMEEVEAVTQHNSEIIKQAEDEAKKAKEPKAEPKATEPTE